MAASRNDMNLLSSDATFNSRVKMSLVLACVSISNEAHGADWRERQTQVVNILNAPDSFKALFAMSVATDPVVIADATQAGTVVITPANVAAQAALVTDAHIDNVVSAQFNSYFSRPRV
jgi:hypothetical protein